MPLSPLERNLERLRSELDHHAGPKIIVLGQAGAGKSTLVNKLTAGVAEPKPVVGSQTDATNWSKDGAPLISRYGVYAYVDAPGYDTAAHPAAAFVHFPFDAVDATVLVLSGKVHQSDALVFSHLSAAGKPHCIARSYSESLTAGEKVRVAEDIRDKLAGSALPPVFFFSNRTGRGARLLHEWILHQVTG